MSWSALCTVRGVYLENLEFNGTENSSLKKVCKQEKQMGDNVESDSYN